MHFADTRVDMMTDIGNRDMKPLCVSGQLRVGGHQHSVKQGEKLGLEAAIQRISNKNIAEFSQLVQLFGANCFHCIFVENQNRVPEHPGL